MPRRSEPAKLRRERQLNLRELGNHLARVRLDHCVDLAISETSVTDDTLTAINTERGQLFGQCEFKDAADGDVLSLPLTLTKAHITTWAFGELPISEDTKPFFKIAGLATESTHAEDVAALLTFDGGKYANSLSGDDRVAADLLRRAVTQGPAVYLKPAPGREGASPARASPGRARWVEDSDMLDKLMIEKEAGKSKYLCDGAFKKRKAITIIHSDGSEVKLTWRGAIVYQYTHAKLIKSIKKFNTLLAPEAKRKRGRAAERFPTEATAAKRADKVAKKGSRPRTNTAKVKQAQQLLGEAQASKRHRTEQRNAARAKYHEAKQRMSFIKKLLEKALDAHNLSAVEGFVSKMLTGKPRSGGDQKAKWIKFFLKGLDKELPAQARRDGPDESEYDSDSESEGEDEEEPLDDEDDGEASQDGE